MNMKNFKVIFSAVCGLMFASCSLIDFSEDCVYKGNVQIRFNWEHLIEEDVRPTGMHTLFYSQSESRYQFHLKGDSLLQYIMTGNYQVLTFNSIGSTSFTGQENLGTFELHLPVSHQNGKRYTVQAPSVYADKQEVSVKAYETTECHLSPRPCTQRINFRFTIICKNIQAEPLSLDAEFSGVSTVYRFAESKASGEPAVLAFSSIPYADKEFRAGIRVLGLNVDKKTPNELSLKVGLSDKSEYRQTLDLSGLFESFAAPVMDCHIEISISGLGITLAVTDWRVGEHSTIYF